MRRQRCKESEKPGKRHPRKHANKERSLKTRESKPQPQHKYKARTMFIASQTNDMAAIKIKASPLATVARRQDNESANHSTPWLEHGHLSTHSDGHTSISEARPDLQTS